MAEVFRTIWFNSCNNHLRHSMFLHNVLTQPAHPLEVNVYMVKPWILQYFAYTSVLQDPALTRVLRWSSQLNMCTETYIHIESCIYIYMYIHTTYYDIHYTCVYVYIYIHTLHLYISVYSHTTIQDSNAIRGCPCCAGFTGSFCPVVPR